MYKALIFAGVLVVLGASSGGIHPRDASAEAMGDVDIVGEWRATWLRLAAVNHDGWTEETMDWKLEVISQQDGILEGKLVYSSSGNPGHDGVKDTHAREFKLLGVFDAGRNEIMFVSVGEADASYYNGRILASDRIEWVLYEPGMTGWVGRVVSERK